MAIVTVLWFSPALRAQSTPETGSEGTVRDLTTLLAAERERVTALEAEIVRRREALTELGQRLDALVRSAAEGQPPRPAAPSGAAIPETKAADTPDIPRFDFYSDALLRLATLHQDFDGCVGCPARTVGRMRVRFGVQGQLTPGLRAVVGLATGELNDPNTVYQTFGGNLGRKVASWDRAYLVFHPKRASWLELTGGKFPYPWVRSSMTFDVDFYPEGGTARLSFATAHAGPISSLSLQALQVVVNEQASGPDMLLTGGQAIVGLKLTNRVASRLILTEANLSRPEHVLRAQMDGSNVGVRNTNAIVGIGTSAVYQSRFRYANVMLENVVQTHWPSLPVTAALEYQHNLRASSSRDTGLSFRLDAGRAQRAGDWTFGWHVFRVEQDAILAALGESDWRGPSNVLQHRFAVSRTLHEHTQALFTWYRGRTLDRRVPGALLAPNLPSGQADPWTNRFYFDILYRF